MEEVREWLDTEYGAKLKRYFEEILKAESENVITHLGNPFATQDHAVMREARMQVLAEVIESLDPKETPYELIWGEDEVRN